MHRKNFSRTGANACFIPKNSAQQKKRTACAFRNAYVIEYRNGIRRRGLCQGKTGDERRRRGGQNPGREGLKQRALICGLCDGRRVFHR